MDEAETAEYWTSYSHADLAFRCAVLHRHRREAEEKRLSGKIEIARQVISSIYVRGRGIEVGAGSRPFPTDENAQVFYGDIRDKEQLQVYFGREIEDQAFIDAQTFYGIADESQDFVISAHVIEHLYDPFGAIVQGIRVLRPGGVYVLVVPNMQFTFDVDRPVTELDHLIADSLDGGIGTLRQAYLEHMLYVHARVGGQPVSQDEMDFAVENGLSNKLDIHVHAWNDVSLRKMLDYLAPIASFDIDVFTLVINEIIVVLRKR